MDISGDFYEAVVLFSILSVIPLLSSLVVGLCVSILQAATQIQENTLTFVPKLFTVMIALFISGPWMVEQITKYFEGILNSLSKPLL